MYVVAEVSNTDYEILISKPFKTREEARQYMKKSYLDIMSVNDSKDVVKNDIEEDSYRVFLYNCNFYYGQIKELKEE